jgi:hypothetical protein
VVGLVEKENEKEDEDAQQEDVRAEAGVDEEVSEYVE